MARRKTDPEQNPAGMSFEDSLAGLETIVESMENDNLPLEDLVAGYEKGAHLLDRCESVLSSARKRIEMITLRGKDAPESAISDVESDTDDTHSLSTDVDAPDDDDDIRLF